MKANLGEMEKWQDAGKKWMKQNSIPLFFFLDSIPLVGIVLQICLLMSKVHDIIYGS